MSPLRAFQTRRGDTRRSLGKILTIPPQPKLVRHPGLLFCRGATLLFTLPALAAPRESCRSKRQQASVVPVLRAISESGRWAPVPRCGMTQAGALQLECVSVSERAGSSPVSRLVSSRSCLARAAGGGGLRWLGRARWSSAGRVGVWSAGGLRVRSAGDLYTANNQGEREHAPTAGRRAGGSSRLTS